MEVVGHVRRIPARLCEHPMCDSLAGLLPFTGWALCMVKLSSLYGPNFTVIFFFLLGIPMEFSSPLRGSNLLGKVSVSCCYCGICTAVVHIFIVQWNGFAFKSIEIINSCQIIFRLTFKVPWKVVWNEKREISLNAICEKLSFIFIFLTIIFLFSYLVI